MPKSDQDVKYVHLRAYSLSCLSEEPCWPKKRKPDDEHATGGDYKLATDGLKMFHAFGVTVSQILLQVNRVTIYSETWTSYAGHLDLQHPDQNMYTSHLVTTLINQ